MRQLARRAGAAASAAFALAALACTEATLQPGAVVRSIVLTPGTASIFTGASLPLAAVVRDAGGQEIRVPRLAWSSGDTSIATVSDAGVVLGRRAGETVIAASRDGTSGLSRITVTNRAVASVAMTPAALSLVVGATGTLQARPLDSQGLLLTGREVTWTSSDVGVATVSASGVVTARAIGSATVTAVSEQRAGAAVVTVSAVPVASVTITPALDTLRAGSSRQLVAALRDAAGGALTGRTVAWSSANINVATVSANGLVVAVAPGTTTVTAQVEGRVATSTIVVQPRPVAVVSITPPGAPIVVGTNVQLSAQLLDAAGGLLLGRATEWTTSDAAVATVDATGRVRGIAPGSARITAASEGIVGSVTVLVIAVPTATVAVTPSVATVFTGGTVLLTATARSAQGDILAGRVVRWQSSQQSVATVSATGVVTGMAPGSAAISAEVEGVTGIATITVRVTPVASVTVTPAALTIERGTGTGGSPLVAQLRDANGNVLTNRVVTWSSSDESIAFVTSAGLVFAERAGIVTITATSEGISGTARVTVR